MTASTPPPCNAVPGGGALDNSRHIKNPPVGQRLICARVREVCVREVCEVCFWKAKKVKMKPNFGRALI